MDTKPKSGNKFIVITINGKKIRIPEGTRLIDAIRDYAGINIPGICYKKGLTKDLDCVPGSCRSCQVQLEGKKGTITACEAFTKPGMSILTNTQEILEGQKNAVTLIAQTHPGKCLACTANGKCVLQEQSSQLNISCLDRYTEMPVILETPSIVFDSTLCINCGRCAFVCPTSAIGRRGRGINRRVGPPPGIKLEDVCVFCGQCTKVCPTAALTEKTDISIVETALADPSKHVFIQIAPAVRVAVGEEFGLKTAPYV